MTAPYNELEVRLNHTVVWVCMQLRKPCTHTQSVKRCKHYKAQCNIGTILN